MSDNPFVRRQLSGTHSHGQKSERKTAKRLGGVTRPGSGSLDGAKGDIVLPKFLVENKATEHKSISLKLSWLEKIADEACAEGRVPALSIQFVDKNGKSIRSARWVMMPEDEWKELTE